MSRDANDLLTRDETAAALRETGIRMTVSTLSGLQRGDGPPFQRFGQRPYYKWADVQAWVHSRLKPNKRI